MNIGRTYAAKVPRFKQKVGQGSLSVSLQMRNRTSMKKLPKLFLFLYCISHQALGIHKQACRAFCFLVYAIVVCSRCLSLLTKQGVPLLCNFCLGNFSAIDDCRDEFIVFCKYILNSECWIVMGILSKLQRFIIRLITFSTTQLILF